MIELGTPVVVEAPSYLGALSAFRAAGARLLRVPMDEEGMRMDALVERLLARHRPQLIYTLPAFQNPSGKVMSAEQRQALLRLAQRYQVPVLEDDPYGALYYGDPPPPPAKSSDSHGHVIYLSTFSKILLPGIRLGWLIAPRSVVDRLASIKQHADLNSNTPAQWALVEFIGRPGWRSTWPCSGGRTLADWSRCSPRCESSRPGECAGTNRPAGCTCGATWRGDCGRGTCWPRRVAFVAGACDR